MNFSKKSVFLSLLLMISCQIFASEWPIDISANSKGQKNASIKYNFGDDRHGNFANGFVFSSGETDVKSSAVGKVIFTNEKEKVPFDSFNPTIGKSVIVAYPDKMICVYANLSQIDSQVEGGKEIAQSSLIGKVGQEGQKQTGFHEKGETLGFQVIDTLNKVSVNSVQILPKNENISTVYPGTLYLENRQKSLYNLNERKKFQSGFYSLYRDFSSGRMPLKTSVSVNGEKACTIDYDFLSCKNGFLCVHGKDFYPVEKIYALPKKQFLGDIKLVRGKNEIAVTLTDFNRNERKIIYVVDAY